MKAPIGRRVAEHRRKPFAAIIVMLLALVVTGGVYTAFAGGEAAKATDEFTPEQILKGKQLFMEGCASCHGLDGAGTHEGPSLVGAGAAAVYFQVETGRMPLVAPGAQAPRKDNPYTEEEVEALMAFVASLGPGPTMPTADNLDTSNPDVNVTLGGQLFRDNCSQCHNVQGNGGALSEGAYAPTLKGVTTAEIWTAMVTGPENMPKFPADGALTENDLRDIVAYVEALQEAPSVGGWSVGGQGPVTEGLFIWIAGMGILIAVAVWIGVKAR